MNAGARELEVRVDLTTEQRVALLVDQLELLVDRLELVLELVLARVPIASPGEVDG